MNFNFETMQPVWQNIVQMALLWGPRLLAASVILLITHFVAKGCQKGIAKISERPAWNRSNATLEATQNIWSQAGKLVYWLVWLFGFLVALQPLELGQVVAPLNALLSQIGAFLPKLIGAGAILIVGLAVSRIVKGVAENAAGMMQVDRLVGSAEDTDAKSSTTVSGAIGTIVQLLILLPIALAAIDVLGIDAVSQPIRELLSTILTAVPHVAAAAVVLAIAFFIGRWIASAAEAFLAGAGVDDAGKSIGFDGENFHLSRISYHLVLLSVMLFAFTEAARLLQFDVVSNIANEVVRLGGHVAFGAAIIAASLFLARIVSRLMEGNGDSFVSRLASYAIMALGFAMGLSFMGIAPVIVNIAFGVTLGAAALTLTVAFGLGGRQTAHEVLQDWKKERKAPTKPAPKAKAAK